ncbi:hypothetical protein V0M98_32420 (plasmid) [Pseudomonas silesiensis]|uniref:hypothetical protein n=1 Tax=Pseudomonas silesiensis TaxID=1853130 RepID=UPI0030D142CE
MTKIQTTFHERSASENLARPNRAQRPDHVIHTQDDVPTVTLAATAYEAVMAHHAALLADRDHLLSLLRTAKASRFDFMANDPLQRNITAALALERPLISLGDLVDRWPGAEVAPEPDSEVDNDWRMNPCKLGHTDVGAGMGIAMCNVCKEKICRETSPEAAAEWNRNHPAAKVA